MLVIRFNKDKTLKNCGEYQYCTLNSLEEALELCNKIEGVLNQKDIKKIWENNKDIIVARYCIIILEEEHKEMFKEDIKNNKIPTVI